MRAWTMRIRQRTRGWCAATADRLRTAAQWFADARQWDRNAIGGPGSFFAAAQACRRAEDLLVAWLTPEQREQYRSRGEFDVYGSVSRKRYRISAHQRTYNVAELDGNDRVRARYCFGPIGLQGDLPMGDVMLAQKLALELDEAAALAIANARVAFDIPAGGGALNRLFVG